MSNVFKASILLAFFFGINKVVALLRQTIIARQFGFSPAIDAFNVSNNLPDLLFSLISGGALTLAFIPIISEYIETKSRRDTWKLFSNVANIVFLLTAVLSILVGIFAEPLVQSELGIAPGFNPSQQQVVVDLMRINLFATLIFSISGLVMSVLQAHKHFLFPAIAPIFYNVGQIIGALVLAPARGFDMGIYGLAVGVVLGSVFHLGIQIPGLLKYGFQWFPYINFKDEGLKKVLALMGPRILTVFLIQIIFLSRDNFASRLEAGAVTALTYGYFIFQVPETLIGTALGTALLPTLSQLVSAHKKKEFETLLYKSLRILAVISILATIATAVSLPYLMKLVFNFDATQSRLLIFTTNAYMIGLISNTILEVVVRAFYARQEATVPLTATFVRAIIFIVLAFISYKTYGPIGLALADTIAVTVETFILLYLLRSLIRRV